MGSQRSNLFLGAGAAATAAYFGLPEGVAQAVWYVAVGLAAFGAVLVGIRLWRPPSRAAWIFLAGVPLVNVLGDVVWYVYELVLHQEPYPSAADFFYLMTYPLYGLGFVLLARGRSAGRDRPGVVDALIVATGGGVVAWVFLMWPYVSDGSLSSAERLITVSYPVGDVLLLAVAARLAFAPGGRSRAYWLLAGGLGLMLVSDVVYAVETLEGTYSTGALVDAGWLLCHVLLAGAALHPSMAALAEPGPSEGAGYGRFRFGLLVATSLLPSALLIQQTVRDTNPNVAVIAGASMILFLLVLGRMRGLMLEVESQAVILDRLARTDALTGLSNRRIWEEQAPRELARAGRSGSPLCVALLDLDRFKEFNDTHGHQAGDQMLRDASVAWLERLRPSDLLARYGGEEFLVLLPDCALEEAGMVIDRLRRGTPSGETCSAGIAQWDGKESLEHLLGRVDEALYRAKQGGRDRSEVSAGSETASDLASF